MAQGEGQVYSEPVSAAGKLHELGVREDVLQEAIQSGLQHAFACTRHDPPILPGILAWGKIMRHLRDRLVPGGWEMSNARNYATVIHPQGGFAVAVAAGDANTGRPDLTPSTRTEKGPATRDAVHQNQLTFADVSESFPRPKKEPGKQTWLLLHYADEEAEEIRAELSLPVHMGAQGHVTAWRERIILRPIPFTTNPPEEGEDGGDLDIAVKPRGT